MPSHRLFLLVNYRPEYRHDWGSKSYYGQLRLDPLPPETAETLLGALLGADRPKWRKPAAYSSIQTVALWAGELLVRRLQLIEAQKCRGSSRGEPESAASFVLGLLAIFEPSISRGRPTTSCARQ